MTPEEIIRDQLQRGYGPNQIVQALYKEGWHLISDAELTEYEAPVENPATIGWRDNVLEMHMRVDDQILSVKHHMAMDMLRAAHDESKLQQHRRYSLSTRLVTSLGKYLSLPGFVSESAQSDSEAN